MWAALFVCDVGCDVTLASHRSVTTVTGVTAVARLPQLPIMGHKSRKTQESREVSAAAMSKTARKRSSEMTSKDAEAYRRIQARELLKASGYRETHPGSGKWEPIPGFLGLVTEPEKPLRHKRAPGPAAKKAGRK